MTNQEKLECLIKHGSFELSGSAMENNLSGADMTNLAGLAELWFHGNQYEELAEFCACKFETEVISPAPNHFQVVTKSTNLKEWEE